MKKIKGIFVLLSFVLFFNISCIIALAAISCPDNCNYLISDYCLPQYSSYTYYKTSSTPSTASGAIENAMSAWNAVDSSMTLSVKSITKPFDTTDSYNTIGTVLSQDDFAIVAGTYTAVAVNSLRMSNSKIINSDIALCGYYAFGNGQSNNYYDYQGIFTHELGHTWGLMDIYESSAQFNASNVNELPAMYGSVTYSGFSSNVTVFLRYLKTGDKNGLGVVKSVRGF